MAIVERHMSPDKVLELIVDLTGDDWTIGFDGCAWHTHGNILHAWGYSGSVAESTRWFVDDVISSRTEICVYRIDGRISDISIPGPLDDRPLRTAFAKYAPSNETMEIRYWNGQPAPE